MELLKRYLNERVEIIYRTASEVTGVTTVIGTLRGIDDGTHPVLEIEGKDGSYAILRWSLVESVFPVQAEETSAIVKETA